MEFKDYYATLGVSKTASAKEIKQAFRKLARKYHPDVNPGDKTAEAKFKDLNEAHEVLGDPETRKKYDELGANWRQYERAQAEGGSPFGTGRGSWQTGPSGYRTMTPEEAAELFGDESPFSDFFTTFFGGAAREPKTRDGRRRQRAAGHDVEHEIVLSLEDAQAGVTRRLTLSYGDGTRSVDVRIPAGVGDGSRVRVAGEGVPGAGGGAAGDLYLRVRLEPHPIFERKGRDLHVTTSIPVTTAVLGGEAEVKTLTGKPAPIRIPPFTQNGQRFRLKGYGLPAVGRTDDTGDLYVRVEVQVPTHLTNEEREHYEALGRLAGTSSAAAGSARKGTS